MSVKYNMVKKINILKIHKNKDETESKNIDEDIFTDDTVGDLKGKIYKATGIIPPHMYVWFETDDDVDYAYKILYKFYYSMIKQGEISWLTKEQVDTGFKYLGLGGVDPFPEPIEEDRYKYRYFEREDVIKRAAKILSTRNVGYWVDNKNFIYNPPSTNPYLLSSSELLELPTSCVYVDMTKTTLEYFGNIKTVHVVDVNSASDEFWTIELRKRYCPTYNNEVDEDVVTSLYNEVIYPKFNFVSGYRSIDNTDYITEIKTNEFYICFNDDIQFPKHIDLVSLFNNFQSDETIPYVEIIDPISYEKIHKISINKSTSIPYLEENVLREWVDEKIPNGRHNYLVAKILIDDTSLGKKYGELRIFNRGKIEFIGALEKGIDFKKINSGWNILDKIINIIKKNVVDFMNDDYLKFVNDNMKVGNSTKIYNNIPKKIVNLIPLSTSNKTDFYNKILTNSKVQIYYKLKDKIDSGFPSFVNCLNSFVLVDNSNLIKNQKVRFRLNVRDNFDLNGIINDVLVDGKYNVSMRIDDVDAVKLDDFVIIPGSDVVWRVTDMNTKKFTLAQKNNSMVDKVVNKTDIKKYLMYFPNVKIYNILNDKSSERNRRMEFRWCRISEFKRLSNLGKEILEYMRNGYLRIDSKGSEADKEIRRKLSVRYGGITRSELEEHIVNIRNSTKNNISETTGHSGIPIVLDLEPEIDDDKSNIYCLTVDTDDLNKIGDIADFFNKLFYSYEKFMNTYTEKVDGKLKFKKTGITNNFDNFVKKYGFPLEFNRSSGELQCNHYTRKQYKDDLSEKMTDTDEEMSDTEEGVDEDMEDDDDVLDDDDVWGIAFGMDDDEEDMITPEEDTKIAEIEFQYPQNHGDLKDADEWAKNMKTDDEIVNYENVGIFKTDERMRDAIILSKLYKRDPTLFKWERVNYEPYSRLCQPADRYPIILNDDEKAELESKIEKGIADPYAEKGSNDCSYDKSGTDYEKCGSLRYGSTKKNQHWFICPKIWCPACKISINEDSIVDEDRCPQCNRVVIDRSKWYTLDDGKRAYGWPGFEKSSKHPKNLWVPCCFKKHGKEDKNSPIIDRIKTVYNVDISDVRKQNSYIIRLPKKILEKGRIGVLPLKLDKLFQNVGINEYDIRHIPNLSNVYSKSTTDDTKAICSVTKMEFPLKNLDKHLKKYINFYYRVGIGNSYETRDFLSLIANIYENRLDDDMTFSREDLIERIIKNLTPKMLSKCNRGVLDILFRDINDDIIPPFQNFIEYLTSNENIFYGYLWELCTQKNDWLFKRGLRLILVDVGESGEFNVVCPPFPTDKFNCNDYAIAIRYNSNDGYIFEPVYNYYYSKKNIIFSSIHNDKMNAGYNVIKELYGKTRKCDVTPNFNLLSNIYKNRGEYATPMNFPLYPLRLVESLLKSNNYVISKYIRDVYNKIIGFSVYLNDDRTRLIDGSRINFFVPIYPSGPDDMNKRFFQNITNIQNAKFTNFFETHYYLQKLYKEVVGEHNEHIIRINTLPVEIILNNYSNVEKPTYKKDKIVAIVTNSKSIIPIKHTEIDTSNIVDGKYYFTDLEGNKLSLPISKRKYYRKLDTYIRSKPIGILQYSKNVRLQDIVKMSDLTLKKIIIDTKSGEPDLYFAFFKYNSRKMLIPIENNDVNPRYINEMGKTLIVRKGIFEWCRNAKYNYKIDNVVESLNIIWKRFDIPVRPVRYIFCNNPTFTPKSCENTQVIGLLLETGLQIPVLEISIIDALQLDIELFILNKHDKTTLDYYIDVAKKDERMLQISKLEFEEELFNIIKYEFSMYLQRKEGKSDREELLQILDDKVFDLLYTRIAREKIYNILEKYLEKYGTQRLHQRKLQNNSIMNKRLENYNIPFFRDVHTTRSAVDCEDNPHYIYKSINRRDTDGKVRQDPRKSGCKIIIPKQNLIHKDIIHNKRNKIYRIVDDIIRKREVRMEILNGLVPKSIVNKKYTPINEDEKIYTSTELAEDDIYVALYKRNISQNLRKDEYGNVVDTFDDAEPEDVDGDFKNEKMGMSMSYLGKNARMITVVGTGEREFLF